MAQPSVAIEADHVVQRPAQRIEVVDPGDDDEPDAAAPAALI